MTNLRWFFFPHSLVHFFCARYYVDYSNLIFLFGHQALKKKLGTNILVRCSFKYLNVLLIFILEGCNYKKSYIYNCFFPPICLIFDTSFIELQQSLVICLMMCKEHLHISILWIVISQLLCLLRKQVSSFCACYLFKNRNHW